MDIEGRTGGPVRVVCTVERRGTVMADPQGTLDDSGSQKALSALRADREREDRTADARQAALDKTRDVRVGAEQKELAPLESRASALEGELQTLTPPKPTELPEWKPRPIIERKDYERFAWQLLAMAAIGGVASKGNWLGVSASLNGALKGYLAGSHERAKKDYEDFREKYDEAKAKNDAALKEFETILQSKTLSINSILSQIRIAAAKYGREDIRQAAEQKSIDGIWRQVEATDRSIAQLEMSKLRLDTQLGANLSDVNAGIVAMIKTGMPLNQAIPGFGNAAVNQRRAAEVAAIQSLAQEKGMSEAEAGTELARRQSTYKGFSASTVQQAKMLGATEQLLANLNWNIDQAEAMLKKMPGVDLSPFLNAIVRKEEYWTGDPKYAGLYYYLDTVMNEAARIKSGGAASVAQLHEGAAERARAYLDANWTTPKMFIEGIAPALRQEGANRVQNFKDEIELQSQRLTTGGTDSPVLRFDAQGNPLP